MYMVFKFNHSLSILFKILDWIKAIKNIPGNVKLTSFYDSYEFNSYPLKSAIWFNLFMFIICYCILLYMFYAPIFI